jgi:hypothetical protein
MKINLGRTEMGEMIEKKIVVPEGMLNAYFAEVFGDSIGTVASANAAREKARRQLEVALKWLSENPIVPTDEQSAAMVKNKEGFPFESYEWVRWGATEWQRRMFLAPIEEVPEEVKDLLVKGKATTAMIMLTDVKHDSDVLEAFRRGKQAGLDIGFPPRTGK